MIGRLVRLDARRPASWIAAVAGFVAMSWILARPAPAWVAAGCGSLLAVAAAGFLADLAAVPGLILRRAVARAAWPALGILAAGIGGRPAAVMPPIAAALLGGLATLAIALAVAAGGWRRLATLDVEESAVGGWIDAVAMGSVLVAMAVCYFLAPQLAGWYAVVAGAWFVGLVVPRSTRAGGEIEARRMLVASAVGSPRLPGTPRQAARMLATGAAILGWPAIVAAALWNGPTWTPSGPTAALALLTTLAGAAAASVRLTRVHDDAPLALAAGTLAAAFARFAQAP
ncbi:MAG: hypothetical protein ACKO40_10015 [Planctomycetaceae bacterium]